MCTRLLLLPHTYVRARTGDVRGKPSYYRCTSGKIDLPRRFIRSLLATKEFSIQNFIDRRGRTDEGGRRRTDYESSYSIFCSNNATLYDLAGERSIGTIFALVNVIATYGRSSNISRRIYERYRRNNNVTLSYPSLARETI